MKNPKQNPVRGKNYMHQQAVAKNGRKPFQEIRTVKGEEIHPSTFYNIAMMIQIYINERVDNKKKIMEDNDFHGLLVPNTFSFGAVFYYCTNNFK